MKGILVDELNYFHNSQFIFKCMIHCSQLENFSMVMNYSFSTNAMAY